jgi:hypothetical protein
MVFKINNHVDSFVSFGFNHMFNDSYRMDCQYLKSITLKENYIFYSLIIIIITKNLTNVRCELFKMSKANHITIH